LEDYLCDQQTTEDQQDDEEESSSDSNNINMFKTSYSTEASESSFRSQRHVTRVLRKSGATICATGLSLAILLLALQVFKWLKTITVTYETKRKGDQFILLILVKFLGKLLL
jgi:hypothetical protein